MIESSLIPQQAVDYLNKIEADKSQEQGRVDRAQARTELLDWCNSWLHSTKVWRKSSYEDEWLKFQRNADGRYDPVIAGRKKTWQSKAFVDLTPSHREAIHAELFRLVAGSRPILDVTPRPGGDPEQAENIRDLELRELEKSRFEVEQNKVIEDKTTYGSGFCRLWYENRVEERPQRTPINEELNIFNPASLARFATGRQQILGYQTVMQPKTIYRGVRMQYIPIWDFFWDPKALEIKGNTCAARSKISYQGVLDRVTVGDFMPECLDALRDLPSDEVEPEDKTGLMTERGISESTNRRQGNQRSWRDFDLYGRLPQKWIYPLLKEPQEVTDPEALIPARVIFHEKTIFAVELNDSYAGEPPFFKDDYFPVSGRFIGRGIPEMLVNPQLVINEVVNQRLDEGNLALQEGYVVVQKAILNPNDLIEGGPGLIVRADEKKLGPNGDVRNILMPLGRPDVKINAGFAEVHEWERMAQERTSANKVTLADQGRYQGAQRTLGGMQMLKSQAGEKFAFIAMLSEFTYLHDIFEAYWELIYTNATMEDVVASLGPERAQKFQLLSPEDIKLGYKYEPKGIFEQEAKAEMQARLQAIYQQFMGAPWLNGLAFFDAECKSFDIDPARLKVPEAQAQEIMVKAQMMAQPMAKQMLSEMAVAQANREFEGNVLDKMASAQADMNGPEKSEENERPAD